MDNVASLPSEMIASLTGMPTVAISEAVETKITECLEILADKGYPAKRPTVTYDLKGHTAGRAHGGSIMRLNLDLLLNPDTQHEQLNVTVPHELCHNVQRQSWPNSKSHGYEWQRLMLLLGLQPDRTHTMQTKAARRRTPQARYAYYCSCPSRIHYISQTRHNKIQRGTATYKCRDCNGRLVN